MDVVARARVLAQQATQFDSLGFTAEAVPLYEQCVQLLNEQKHIDARLEPLAQKYSARAAELKMNLANARASLASSPAQSARETTVGFSPAASSGLHSNDDESELAARLAALKSGTSVGKDSPEASDNHSTDFAARAAALGVGVRLTKGYDANSFHQGSDGLRSTEDEVARVMREAMDAAALSDGASSGEEAALAASRRARGDLGPAPAAFKLKKEKKSSESPNSRSSRSSSSSSHGRASNKASKKSKKSSGSSKGAKYAADPKSAFYVNGSDDDSIDGSASSGDLDVRDFADAPTDTDLQKREKAFMRSKIEEQKRQRKAAYDQFKRDMRL